MACEPTCAGGNSGSPPVTACLPAQALETIRERQGLHDPRIVAATEQITGQPRSEAVLRPVLASDAKPTRDTLIVAGGNEVTSSLLLRLRNLLEGSVREPIRVLVRA